MTLIALSLILLDRAREDSHPQVPRNSKGSWIHSHDAGSMALARRVEALFGALRREVTMPESRWSKRPDQSRPGRSSERLGNERIVRELRKSTRSDDGLSNKAMRFLNDLISRAAVPRDQARARRLRKGSPSTDASSTSKDVLLGVENLIEGTLMSSQTLIQAWNQWLRS